MVTRLAPLLAFALAASITPGPNNVMAAAAAANHGLRKTVPQVLGVVFGFAVMVAVVAMGVASTLAAMPRVATVLRAVCLLWLLYLAWRIASAAAPGQGPTRPPLGFFGAALFQWVNPKAWMMALGAAGAFVRADRPLAPQVAVLFLTFLIVSLPCTLSWAALGRLTGRLLGHTWRLRAFNVGMAALMVLSMLPLAFE